MSTRAEVLETARRRRRARRAVGLSILVVFAVLAFVLSGSGRWAPLLAVVAAATALLALVLREAKRVEDQRVGIVRLILVVVGVCLLPPLVLVVSYDAVLEPISLMRILLMLWWSSIGILVWSLFDRWRSRARPMDNAAWVGILVAVITGAATVAAPLAGLAAVGRPQTYVVNLTSFCSDSQRTVPDGLLGEMETSAGNHFSSMTKDGQLHFVDVPYFLKTRWSLYFPPTAAPLEDDGSGNAGKLFIKQMKNGDIRVSTPWLLRDPLSGYVEILESLISFGYLEPAQGLSVTFDTHISCGAKSTSTN